MGNSVLTAVGKTGWANVMAACLDLQKYIKCEGFEERYDVGLKLGSGRFSEVFACFDTHNPTKKYAMKVIRGHKAQGASLARIRDEISIMSILKDEHPYVIHMLDSYQYQTEDGIWCAKLILNLCEGGDLYDYINAHGAYAEDAARLVIAKMTHALAFIHSKRIIHRDLKPENILLQHPNSEGTDIKISDFGVAKRSADGFRIPKSKSLCGSDFYLAPEMLKQEEYGPQVDMWSLGVLCYVILCGGLPFHDEHKATLYQQIVECNIQHMLCGNSAWKSISTGAQRFVGDLLIMDPAKRMTAEKALNHRWLRGTLSPYELLRLPSISHVDLSKADIMPKAITTTTDTSNWQTTEATFDIEPNRPLPHYTEHVPVLGTKIKKLSSITRYNSGNRGKYRNKADHVSRPAAAKMQTQPAAVPFSSSNDLSFKNMSAKHRPCLSTEEKQKLYYAPNNNLIGMHTPNVSLFSNEIRSPTPAQRNEKQATFAYISKPLSANYSFKAAAATGHMPHYNAPPAFTHTGCRLYKDTTTTRHPP